ncbi:thiol reductant ABC exporter subunit CydD [Agromyces seonyuensis]|uniref:Thiol reductant ABC exporter subunit CydD n=1 Tax=Agromyces seonyuensis TaxID=2662446 RepID=A0A6I4P5H5_9MICO|nr:thiol reductant ABC exporter subunit CydD [Agromyces seonyuensis]MWB98684.1 thiol reductant ABC exporter subunit CydD [Agromyces seonyuensis]
MKPLDPRLVRRSRAARGFLLIGAALALVQALATIALAFSIAVLVAGFVGEVRVLPPGGILAPVPEWAGAVDVVGAAWMLAAAAVVRAGAGWAWEVAGRAGASRVKAELRQDLLAALADRAPGALEARTSGRLAALLGNGLDALDDYFGRFLPQLLLTVIATPLLVLAALLTDPLTALILVIVLPIIPIFMVLIGLATRVVQQQQWDELGKLSQAFLEVVGGLATLKLFGRANRQLGRIRGATDDYRSRTMKVLRVTFLSGFALELAASLSVAITAVTVGFRLVDGELALVVGLFVLVLAPEVFLPIRNVGAAFHASSEGVTASTEAFDLLDAAGAEDDASRRGAGEAKGAPRTGAGVEGVLSVLRGGEAVVVDVPIRAARGEITVLSGPSGAGKSSVFAALLGFAAFSGEVRLDGAPLGRADVAWAGQRPELLGGTVAENVRLGDDGADPALLQRALALGGVDVDPERLLGPGGAGLSGGQAQRVATARAIHRLLARDAGLLLLDEPSSALDADREAHLAAALRELADEGRCVLVATHRPALVAAADRVLELRPLAAAGGGR